MLESLEPRRLLASLVIFETDDTTSVGESAIAADTFTVALDQPPNSPVVVSIASVDPTQVRVNNTQITFDTSNWDQPQTVTVEGVSDSIDEPDQTIEIAVAVVDELSDEMFHEAIDQSVDVTIVDDDVAGLAFYDVDSVIQLTEDGFSKNFSVALTSEPTSEVRVQLAIDAQQSKIFQPGSIYSIGNSLSWNARPPLLDGDVEYHNDCGKNLQFIFDNPESPCTNTSRLWTDALLNQQYDWVVVQPFFGTTITQDAAVINHWMSLQPDAVFVIHTGWSTHVDRDADYNGGNPNDQMVHSPEYFDDLIAQLQGTQGNQDRVIRSTHAINILDSFYDDFAAGVSPFDDVTTQFYIDHIHMTPLGQYFAHSALRQALRQPLSNLHFRFLTPELIEYMNSNIEQYSTGADFGSLEIVFDSTNWSTPQSITVSPTDNAELGSIISLVVDPTTADANYAGLPTSSLPVNILALNDRPRFELSGDVLVNEDSGLSTITDLFAAIDTGPGEDDQTVIGYHATNLSDESLFDTLPSFDETGNLIFSSKKDAVGSATLEISIQDDGGTENGTHDTSLPQLLTITIAPVNDPPTFTMINPPVIGKNAGPQIVEGFIREIILGPNDESTQSLMSVSVVNIDRPELFETPPTIDLDGKLHYTPAANQFGTSTFSVTIQDNGGTNAGGRDVSDSQTFTIEIDAANAGPSILGPTRVTSLQPFDLLIDFREPVDGFLLQDTVIAGGNAIQMVDMGNGVYKVTIVPNGEDLITFDVPAGVATNSEGVPNTAATQYVVSVVPIPTPVISGPTNPINANRFDVTIDFGESVSGFSLNEIDVTGGNAINAVIHGGGLFTATIQPNGEGTVIVDIAEGAAKDHDGNPSLAATSYTVVGDTITPTPIISGPNSLTNSPQFDITIDFGETVNGFNLREIDVTGGDAINAVIQGDGVYTVTIVAIGDGTVTIDVDAKVARDLAGNASKAASQFVVVVNESSPTPIITGPIGPVNSNPFQVTIDFGEPVREFYLSEIDVTGGTAINAVIHGNGLYTATILPSGDAMVAVNVAASVALDSENNPNTASNSYSVAADTLPPTPVITGPTSLVNSSRFDVTIDFGEMVNGFNLREIDVTGGNAINAVIHGDGSFTATIAAFGDGTVTIDVDDKVARDLAGNTSKAASQFVVVVNESSPTPIITGPIGPVNSNPFQVTIDFGELVREFYLSEIDVTGGTAINAVIHGNGLYTATILPNGDAMVAVNVAASVAMDSGNNPNTASNSYSVAVDTTVPTPVITGPTSPVNSSRFDVTIDFGEMVNGFNLREIDVTGGNAINAVIHGDGLFTATIQPIGEGTITIDVDAKVARDLAGNASRAASQFSVVVNESSPTPIISGPTSLANTSQFEVTIDFGKTVNGFNLREIDVTGGSAINAVDLGNGLFTATINPTDAGTITINIAAGVARDVAGNANLAAIQYSVMVADPPQSEGLGEGARSAWKQTKFARFADEIFAEGSLLDGIMRKKVSDTFLAR